MAVARESVAERFFDKGGITLLKEGNSVQEALDILGEETTVWNLKRALTHPDREAMAQVFYEIADEKPLKIQEDDEDKEPVSVSLEINGSTAERLLAISESFGWEPSYIVKKCVDYNLNETIRSIAQQILDETGF